jgi:hypothetical protein
MRKHNSLSEFVDVVAKDCAFIVVSVEAFGLTTGKGCRDLRKEEV